MEFDADARLHQRSNYSLNVFKRSEKLKSDSDAELFVVTT